MEYEHLALKERIPIMFGLNESCKIYKLATKLWTIDVTWNMNAYPQLELIHEPQEVSFSEFGGDYYGLY